MGFALVGAKSPLRASGAHIPQCVGMRRGLILTVGLLLQELRNDATAAREHTANQVSPAVVRGRRKTPINIYIYIYM